MSEKQKLIQIVSEIIFQINKILILELDTQEKRNELNITVFSQKCPMCVEYMKDSICDKNCFLSNQKQHGCLNSKTKPKNKYNSDELKIRLLFWEKLLHLISIKKDYLFEIKNRKKLQELIIKIDLQYGN